MWLTSSSIGRKVVMSVTGACLVLFLTFHMLMNLVYVYDVVVGTPAGEHYFDKVCEFLGTNWYALLGTAGLALLIVIHFIYAFILTLQNWKARGNDRYAISGKQPVHWAAKNMLVLGIIVICGVLIHLYNFWSNMMLAELAGSDGLYGATAGFDWITYTLSDPILFVLYIIWFAALWFHLTHGIWSSMQTLGWNGKTWLNRWICISYIWATIIFCGFFLVLVTAVIHKGGFHCICC
ncbi:MAG: succinate dehydrogenase/fumarate reductase cytochrome b subunit [Bacteroidales bacterium]|nr:succinate dehydrogenase/fumarate reductase cytochrome b subunit [Bacteroidales bacterium]